ncbi:protein of RNA polymerase III Rpc4 family [Pseudohyphozyma bogoriensis]|nr:protein of RNA polymerase III Rpc4 family [Pseudohyphozyma bogoriensis]
MEDAPEPDSARAGPAKRRLGTLGGAGGAGKEARPVGGLLGASEYAKKPEKPSGVAKLKFVPNMKRKTKVVQDDDDDDDVGLGVMNRVAGGPQRKGQFDDEEEKEADPDDSDLEQDEDDGVWRLRARDLNDIGAEGEMAPLILPRDPKVVRSALERRTQRQQARLKSEAPDVKPEPSDDSSLRLSATATPGLETDSKASVIVEDEKKATPGAELRDDFDVSDPNTERLYIFQFPRKFPALVNALHGDPTDVKPKPEPGEPGATPVPRKKTPPEWGRAGPRANKGARWSTEEGQIGELCVHRSGKVSLRINNDLHYEVLAAAQPSFLQEVAILDHDPASEPVAEGKQRPESDPNRALLMMGQTSKKFIVVPEVEHLLEKISIQEKEEKEEARRKLALKKETKPRYKRFRKYVSCENCIIKKIKCDKNEPCSPCLMRGLTCEWERAVPINRVTPNEDLEAEIIRLRSVVGVLSERLESAGLSSDPSDGSRRASREDLGLALQGHQDQAGSVSPEASHSPTTPISSVGPSSVGSSAASEQPQPTYALVGNYPDAPLQLSRSVSDTNLHLHIPSTSPADFYATDPLALSYPPALLEYAPSHPHSVDSSPTSATYLAAAASSSPFALAQQQQQQQPQGTVAPETLRAFPFLQAQVAVPVQQAHAAESTGYNTRGQVHAGQTVGRGVRRFTSWTGESQ